MRKSLKNDQGIEALNLNTLELEKEYLVNNYQFSISRTYNCDFIYITIDGLIYYTTAQAVVQEFKRVDAIIEKSQDKALSLSVIFRNKLSLKGKEYLTVEIIIDAPDNSDIWKVAESNDMFKDLGNLEL